MDDAEELEVKDAVEKGSGMRSAWGCTSVLGARCTLDLTRHNHGC